jgi:hypothetical protein
MGIKVEGRLNPKKVFLAAWTLSQESDDLVATSRLNEI